MHVTDWRLARELFDAAIAQPEASRSAWLQQRCGDDALLRLVTEMLAADARLGEHEPASAIELLRHLANRAAEPPTHVGPYRIDALIGRGGMGEVYRAVRCDGTVEQTVAIKFLSAAGASPEVQRRFRRERRILSRLDHPHIARFLDAGSDARGLSYVVMEHVAGVPITQYCAVHRLNVAQRLRLFLQVLDAVAYAHRQLIVHRDLKPANVLVDAHGNPHLLDFGIAKPLADLDEELKAGGETALELRAFSLAYAAPEQLLGGAIGPPCDVYALGVLLYELLSAVPPLALRQRSFAEAERLVLEALQPDPSRRVLEAQVAPDGSRVEPWARALRGDLDRIVQHALRKEPETRYATVEAFAGDLRRHLACEPISLRWGQRAYRARRFVRRQRTVVTLSTLLLLALLSGSAALWRQSLVAARERDEAVVQRQSAQAVTRVLVDAFEAADPSRNRGREVTAREVLDQAARSLQEAPLDLATRIELLATLADVHRTLGLNAEAQSLASTATRDGDSEPAARARAWRVLAEAQVEAGAFDQADRSLELARALLHHAADPARERLELGRVAVLLLGARGDNGGALAQGAALHEAAQAQLGAGDLLSTRIGLDRVLRLRVVRRFDEASALGERLLATIPTPDRNPLGVRVIGDLGRLARDRKDAATARRLVERHREGALALYGPQHRTYAGALDLMAKVAQDDADYPRAETLWREAIAIVEQANGGAPSTAMLPLLNNLSNVQRLHGLHDDAVASGQRAVALADELLPPGHINGAHFRTTTGEALLARGDAAAALDLLQDARGTLMQRLSTQGPGLTLAYVDLLIAEAAHAAGDAAAARSAIERAWSRYQTLDPADPSRLRATSLRLSLRP